MKNSKWTIQKGLFGVMLLMIMCLHAQAQIDPEQELTISPEPYGCMKDTPQSQVITFTPDETITDLTDYSTVLTCQATPFWDADYELTSTSLVDISAGGDYSRVAIGD